LPQINTRTYARAVIAVLALAACSNPSTAGRASTAFSIDLGPEKALRAEFASTFTRIFESVGLPVTNDQANCMANGVLNAYGMDGLDQLMRDGEAGKPDDPAVLKPGADAILGCLPADVAAEVAKFRD
jgi:hypothetical protein